jgi:hypothetical protein
MSDKTELMKANAQMPAWMAEADREGVEDLGQYIIPPRIKVIQKTADEQYAKQFKEGDAVLVPQKVLLVSADEPFYFTPLFFFTEYLVTNPIEVKGSQPFIRERTLDPHSEIAKKARDPERRTEPYPDPPANVKGSEKWEINNVEVLNYLVLIQGREDLTGMPVCLSFSKSEWMQGSRLAGLIKMRRAPIYGCVFQGMVPSTVRRNPQGAWYGIDVGNPDEDSEVSPFVEDEETFASLRAIHLELKEAHSKSEIQVDYAEGTDAKDDIVAAAEESF